MRFCFITLFPELVEAFAATSVVGRARDKGLVQVECEPLRAHGLGRHQSVDDTPYGGGSGMILRVDCIAAALEAAERRLPDGVQPLRVLMTPQGKPFDQPAAERLTGERALILLCGRYEGFDERVRELVDVEVSVGDFVLAGGEVAAMAVVEAVARLLPGVLGNEDSVRFESFSAEAERLLECPQYTRPAEFRGRRVPSVLVSGDHGAIEAWRRARSRERTQARRPDLMASGTATAAAADGPRSGANAPREKL